MAKVGGNHSQWLKRSSEILADENRKNFLGKGKIKKNFMESENISEIGGNLKQGGNASLPLGGWMPLNLCPMKYHCVHFVTLSYTAILHSIIVTVTGSRRQLLCVTSIKNIFNALVKQKHLQAGQINYVTALCIDLNLACKVCFSPFQARSILIIGDHS